MLMKGLLLLVTVLVGCRSASNRQDGKTEARVSAMDTATVRRLCVAPDSVLAGRRSCELRDQRPRVKIF
jgi:hypothetical protein